MKTSISIEQNQTAAGSPPFDLGCVDRLLQSGSRSDCRTALASLFAGDKREGMSSTIMRQYVVTDVYLRAFAFAKRLGASEESVTAVFGGMDTIPAVSQTREGAWDFLLRILERCVAWRAEAYRGGRDAAIDKAKEYIRENYGSEEISLNGVAMAVNLSPAYFSALFKKSAGESFVDYLSNIRVNKAKELLCCTLMQVSEIAYEVGYKDYRYFGKVFKKYTGLTPREYQRKHNK